MTLAGQPAKVGGTITRVLGWIVLGGGWLFALLIVGLLALLGAPGGALLAVGLPIAVVASIVAYALLRGGKELKRSGDDTEQATKNQAVFALARTRNGVLTAPMVAQGLDIGFVEADALLTRLAKEHPDYVTVDVDGDGNVLYRFPSIHWGSAAYGQQMAPNDPHARVAAAPAGPSRIAEPNGARVDAREPLEEELEPVEPAHAHAKAR